MSSWGAHGGCREALGVVLAGGRGRRIGGGKAGLMLGGQPLISYPLAALGAALGDVVVLVKPATILPPLPGATVWIEPAAPSHPLFGIVHALELAEGRPVVVCAVDLPFVPAALISQLAIPGAAGAPATVAAAGGRAQPLVGRYAPRAAIQLGALLRAAPQISLRQAVAALGPEEIEVPAPWLENINTPEDLHRAGARLREGL